MSRARRELLWCEDHYRLWSREVKPGHKPRSCYRFECEHCGDVFKGKNGNKNQFCSRQCKDDYRKRWRTERNCAWCVAAFTPKRSSRDGIVCSRSCAKQYEASKRRVPAPRKLTPRYVSGRSSFVEPVVCEACGEGYTYKRERSDGQPRRFCLTHSDLHGKERRRFNCAECGKDVITSWTGDSRRKFCSDSCCKRHHSRPGSQDIPRSVRRKIGDRDDWVCGLCGDSIDRNEEVPHPYAATIDHIVPRARGGSDELNNLQIAHFRCNSEKGAGSFGSQMRLGVA